MKINYLKIYGLVSLSLIFQEKLIEVRGRHLLFVFETKYWCVAVAGLELAM